MGIRKDFRQLLESMVADATRQVSGSSNDGLKVGVQLPLMAGLARRTMAARDLGSIE